VFFRLSDTRPVGDRAFSARMTARLPKLRSLVVLMLNPTAVTDAGLAHLGRMTNLKALFVGKPLRKQE
jgi:hypothetical protein